MRQSTSVPVLSLLVATALLARPSCAHNPLAGTRATRAPGTPSAEPSDPYCLFTNPCKARPKITLLGANPVRIHVLTANEKGLKKATALDQDKLRHYEDAGASCSDAVDGSLADDVVTTGEIVDLDRTGTYHFHYECYNRMGMAAHTVTREIIVFGRREDDFSGTPSPTPAANFQVDGTVQLSGFTPKSFGSAQQDQFRAAIAEEFAVPPYDGQSSPPIDPTPAPAPLVLTPPARTLARRPRSCRHQGDAGGRLQRAAQTERAAPPSRCCSERGDIVATWGRPQRSDANRPAAS